MPADKRQAAPPAQSDDGSKKTPWRIRLDEVTLNDIALQADDRSRAVPLRVGAGALSAQLALDITAGAATRVQADVARIDAQALAARPLDAEPPWATLDRVELTNGVVNTAERAVTVGRLAVQGGGMRVVREAGGEFQPVAMVRGRAQRDELAESTATSAGAWRFRLDALTTAGLRLAFADQGIVPALAYTLDDIALSLRDLAVGTDKRAGFTLAARVTEGGTLSAEGDFAPDGSSAATKLALGRVALEPLRALLARHAALDLKQGNASAELAIDYKQSDGGPAVQADGSARIDDLRIDEEVTGDRFLAWQSLNADAVEFVSNTEPPQLTVKDVRLTAPRARIEIFEDRSVNLAKVFDKRGVEDASRSPAATDGGDEEPSMRVEVARVRVENGTVFYADHSLVLPFSAQIREFRGAASGITSARDSRARLQFEGRVEDYGSAAVSGALSPFAPKRFTDIRTQFRNIDMPPLSPYSATFAGRKIAEGKLSLDLEYKIDNGRLAGDNDILLERFTLGERVQSPDALDLPLDLAVALLTDSRGRIDIAIPVSGNMNKPEFSLGGVIGEAVTRMLTRIVTAPFSALGKLFGGGEGANHIAFEPGNVRLTPPQQEKLVNVGKALIDRPQLQLTVGGRYDPKRDGEGLRAQHVRRELAGELGIDIAEDEAPAPIAFEQAATQRALEALLEARAGDDAVDAFRADYEKRTGKPVARINPVLGRLGQASADHAFYEAVFDRLVEIYPLADAELEALAQARARAVKEALAGTEGIGAERVAFGKTSAADSNRDGMIETQLSLDVFRAAAK